MADAFFYRQRDAVLHGMAHELGCTPEAFEGDELSFCDRPSYAPWPFTALLCTFGTGTAMSVDPAYREWVTANRPARHFRSFSPEFMVPLIEEGARRGVVLEAEAPNLNFALGRRPARVEDLPGFAFERADTKWMTAQHETAIFHNALGGLDERYRIAKYHFAIVAYDDEGDIAAVAGVFDTAGLYEIGVDVARGFRGHGLAGAVVARATAAILEVGQTPFYSCAVTNIRSQRTALATGYLPVCSLGYIAPKSD